MNKQESNLAAAGQVTLSFSANMRFVRPIRHFIGALCTLADYAEEETESISLVTTEILNNSIEHGSNGPQDEIDVTLLVTRSRFRFEVVDPGRGGKGFASTALNRASHMPELDEPRGRGLFLVRSYMDELQVSYDPDSGTKLMVTKNIEP
ncbi:MAG: ATP-binding protein [Planctomycetota bacterium]